LLTVTATSDDQTLVPDGNITLGGSGASRTVNVLPGTNQNGGPATITVSVFDGATTTQTTFDVTVSADNDAPVAALAFSGYGVDEDDSARLITGASISDVDAGADDVFVTVSVNDGDLTVTTTAGLTFTAGANGSSTFTAEGTISELNGALGTLRYQPDPNFNGTDTLTLFIDDLGNSGGGSQTSMDTATITVNDVPLLDLDADNSSLATGNDFSQSFEEGGGPVSLVDGDVTLSDIDSVKLASITVVLANRLEPVPKEDLSADASDAPLAVNWDSGTDTLTINGPGTVADCLTVLSTVKYGNAANNPDATTRTITFVANDGTDDSLIATTTLSFSAVNDAPVISSNGGAGTATVSIAENAAEVSTVISTDVDGGTPIYSISGGADSTTFNIDDGTGILKFVSAPDFESPTDSDGDNDYEVIVLASDQNGDSDTQSITVTVPPVNDNAPTITSNGGGTMAAISIAENSIAVTTVTATDADLPAQELDYTISGGADAARFDIDAASGELTFAAAPNFEAATDSGSDNTYEVIVRVSDGINFFDLQTTTISVTDVDEFDVRDANGGPNSVKENVSNGVGVGTRASAAADGGTMNTITYSLDDDSNDEFFIESSAGDVKVAGPIDRESGATRTIVVRATSEDGSFTTKKITSAINDVNEFAISDITDSDGGADIVDENAASGTTIGITASASDSDATTNVITYSLDDDSNGKFAIDGSSGEVEVAGPIDRETGATRTITVRVTSADGSFSIKEFTIAVNDLDEFDITTISDSDGILDKVDENAECGKTVGVTAFAEDADATTNGITYSLDGNSSGEFEIDASSGEVTVAGAIDREAGATRSITVRATSEDCSFTSKDFTIAINDLNGNSPIIDPDQSFSVSEFVANGDTVGSATATDPDTVGLIQNWSIANGNSDGIFEVDAASGEIRIVDNALLNFESTALYVLGLRVEDGTNTSSTQTVNINVVDQNDVPVLDVNVGASIVEGGSVVITSTELSVSDEDETSSQIRYSVVGTPTAGRLELVENPGVSIGTFTQADIVNDQVRFVNDRSEADDSFTFSISDGSGGTIGTTLFSIANLRVNDANIDGDSLTVVAVTGPANGSLSLNADGSFAYTPNTNFNGVDSFTYRATDGSLQSQTRTVTLNVAAVNDALVSIDDEFTVDQLKVLKVGAADGVLINDPDVEADELQAILVDGPQNGQLVLNSDGALTYTPNATFSGQDTFTYRSFDGTENAAIATVRINVEQTVTSGGDGGDGDIVVEEDADTTGGESTTDAKDETFVIGADAVDGPGESSTDTTLPTPTAIHSTDTSTGTTDVAADATTETDNGTVNGSQNDEPIFEVAFRIDERGELRDRSTGRIVEDAGVVLFTSTDVGSMVYVLEQTGFWTELNTFEQDVQNSILQEGEWEELVVETTTVAGTTLTLGYIVWLLRSGSVVFGLISSLPDWTMMDPLPVLQSGLESLGDTDTTDDDSLQRILQAHHDGMETPAESFET
jgi:hypothetical protein